MAPIIETFKSSRLAVTALLRDKQITARSLIAAVALFAAVAVGCNRTDTKKANDSPKQPLPFAETVFSAITPTADGGAYAHGYDSGLWYLRGPEAITVHFPGLPAEEAQAFLLGLEITPLADGGAYAHALLDKSVWYLREGSARKVTDVPALTTKPISLESNFFPLYVTERRKRLHREEELEGQQEVDDPPDHP